MNVLPFSAWMHFEFMLR